MTEPCRGVACAKPVDRDGLCFRCRVGGTSFTFRGGAREGRGAWNTSHTQHMVENFGTSDDRELAKRGIERASNYGH